MTTAKRAERALRRGFATRTDERQHRMRQRYVNAPDADAALHAAFDWYRSSVHHAHGIDANAVKRAMAAILAADAEALERRKAVTARD
jgi:hypothetical protein